MTGGTAHAGVRARGTLVPDPAAAGFFMLLRYGQVPHDAMTRQARSQADRATPRGCLVGRRAVVPAVPGLSAPLAAR